jgi:AbiV family abortive infection protein
MPLSPETKALATTLIEGAAKTVKNADELFDEARLLAGSGHIARALLLHQISLEECGKAEILYVSLFEVLRGQPVDTAQLSRVLTRHAAKNKTNAYFLPMSEAEKAAGLQANIEAAAAAFDKLQAEFHKESNDLKNASLYVDFDGYFKSPSEAITQDHLTEVYERNGQFMHMVMDKMRIVLQWAADLDSAAEEVAAVWATFGADTLEKGKPETVEAFKRHVKQMIDASAGRP